MEERRDKKKCLDKALALIEDWRKKEILKWPHGMGITMGICRGIQFLHTGTQHGIFGNDLKVETVLLDDNLTTKISSYNISLSSKVTFSKLVVLAYWNSTCAHACVIAFVKHNLNSILLYFLLTARFGEFCSKLGYLFSESGFINLYAKAGEFEYAYKVFDESPERSLGSWNAVIGGLSQSGRARDAVDVFLELKRSGLEPDDVTMVSVISSCGSLGDLGLALQLHKCVFQAKRFGKSDVLMSNSLVDMYRKCGRMDLAYRVFVRMCEKNVSSWTSMIVGYATHGHVRDALECFCGMREARVAPNGVTFVGVLSACVHGGLVEEGKWYFNMMKGEYKIEPWLQHYGCMVDLFGRCGLLEEAREVVREMPMEANVVIWGCLMGACEKYGDVKMGEWVAKHLQQMEPWNDGVYVLMSNIYASNGLWEDVGRMRKIMKERKLEKIPGYSL
ncbi:hypothetical protein L1987_20460 [Smallanthus sonchifolius]|uniref:Uncharacterized protein n=1 Tax=Smallanthus sonchifolius TaxID=185202 RepID=A0ACB9IUT0_9ASTR|nr:hypothetical protein L1987_20460 [Smallanthus sonchifolius]